MKTKFKKKNDFFSVTSSLGWEKVKRRIKVDRNDINRIFMAISSKSFLLKSFGSWEPDWEE